MVAKDFRNLIHDLRTAVDRVAQPNLRGARGNRDSVPCEEARRPPSERRGAAPCAAERRRPAVDERRRRVVVAALQERGNIHGAAVSNGEGHGLTVAVDVDERLTQAISL